MQIYQVPAGISPVGCCPQSTVMNIVNLAIKQFQWNLQILKLLVQNFEKLTDLVETKISYELFETWFSYYIGIRDEYHLVYYGVMIPQYHEDRNYCFIHARHGLDETNSGNNFLKISCSHDGLRFLFNEGNNKKHEDALLMKDNMLLCEFKYIGVEVVEIFEHCEKIILQAMKSAGFTILKCNIPHVHPYVMQNEEIVLGRSKAQADKVFSGSFYRQRADEDSSKAFTLEVLGVKFASYESIVRSARSLLLSSSSASSSSTTTTTCITVKRTNRDTTQDELKGQLNKQDVVGNFKRLKKNSSANNIPPIAFVGDLDEDP